VSANKYQSRATVEEAKEMPIPARLFGEAAARASAIEARSVAFSPKVIRVRASDALGLHKTPEGVSCSARQAKLLPFRSQKSLTKGNPSAYPPSELTGRKLDKEIQPIVIKV
jgi:hypothetical protein